MHTPEIIYRDPGGADSWVWAGWAVERAEVEQASEGEAMRHLEGFQAKVRSFWNLRLFRPWAHYWETRLMCLSPWGCYFSYSND